MSNSAQPACQPVALVPPLLRAGHRPPTRPNLHSWAEEAHLLAGPNHHSKEAGEVRLQVGPTRPRS